MTDRLELVSIGIADIGAVIMGVITRPQPRRALVDTTMSERRCVERIDRRAIPGDESRMRPIAGMCVATVERADDEQLEARKLAEDECAGQGKRLCDAQ